MALNYSFFSHATLETSSMTISHPLLNPPTSSPFDDQCCLASDSETGGGGSICTARIGVCVLELVREGGTVVETVA